MVREGLRERKKQATRRMIADVATGMFVQRGFDNVTVAEIAEAAGVSKMTVFNYFPRKEDLFLDRHADRLRELEQVVRERPAGESVVAAMRRHQHELLAARHPLSGAIEGARGFWLILKSSRALVTRTYEQERETRDMLTGVLAAEIGDRERAAMVSALLTATLNTIFEHAVNRILDGDDADEVRRDQVGVIDRAFDLLEQGLGNLSVS
ncbi:TetR/AcrR family transcriptional regulator [Amycolatopsis pigmentata]|uniref:TetR/AcrR family transcriptional regulator n=1 Tax=Amycolatopsis pigmentata TaxID=450801 RepID=A0ABW5FXG2_9PSEU